MAKIINIFVANLGKYAEGKIVGGWLELPKTEDEIDRFLKETVQISDKYEEYFIVDTNCTLAELQDQIGEYSAIKSLNDIALFFANASDDEIIVAKAIMQRDMNADITKIKDYLEKDNYRIFYNCNDMSDVAMIVAKEATDSFKEIPDCIVNAIDYELMGTDLESSGEYYSVDEHFVYFY